MKIYVATTKKENLILPNGYEYIQVNAANTDIFYYNLKDNIGDNISTKNPNYCELTATYWIWKNDNDNDIVGLMHYRRFLTSNKFSTKPKYFLKESRIIKDLNKYDFISTKMYKTGKTIKEHLLENVRELDFNILRDVIKTKFSDYLAVFDDVFNGNKSYLLNVFISKKSELNDYANWLFDVLFEVEKRVNMEGYSKQEKRLFGYLSERLFTVYILKNKLKVKSYTTCLVGSNLLQIAIKKLLRILHIKKC